MKLFLLVSSLFILVKPAQAQCTNADFESGSFGNWTGTYGTNYNNGNCIFSNPTQYTGFLMGPVNDPDNDAINHYSHVLTTTAGGNDPFLAGNGVSVPVNWPGSGMYSARIGSTWPSTTGAGRNKPDAATMTYTFPVTAADAAFTYHYAVILNVGAGHIPTEQPYFHIRMITSTGDTITCANFDVDASSAGSVGGFDSLIDNGGAGQIYYKNWTSVYVPLYNYIGQTVSIIFTTCSCNPNQCAGKHFAVAYIDAQCGPTSLATALQPSCTQPGYTITAPAGAATYAWSGPGVAAGTHTPSITTLLSGHYSVTMTTFGATPCVFTLDTTIAITPATIFHANFTADTVCLGSPTLFADVSIPSTEITSRSWIIAGNTITTSSVNPTYTFPTAGIFPVRLTVGNTPCFVDTTMNVVVNGPPTSTFTASGPVCSGQTSTITYTGSAAPTDIYTWNFNGATIISGSGAGPYQVKWATTGTKNITLVVTARGCPSLLTTQQVVVTPVPTISLTPDVYDCGGGTATLTPVASPAGGTYLWSTGQTTSSITVRPLVTSRYSVVYTLGTCSASVVDSVIITKPNAGTDQAVSCAILPGGIATMSGTGTGIWTAMTGNPGTATITVPASPTTTITGFTAVGSYKFIMTNVHGCTDTASVTVTAKPNAGPDQSVSCAVLPGGAATMAGTGTGTWTAMTGNPGTATIVGTTSPTTSITTFSNPGVYRYIWTNASGCSDTATITVTAKPNAGPDHTVTCAILPGGTATMAATGAGTWTAMTGNPGTATITSATSPATTITGYTAAGIYKFIWANASGCSDTASITITAKPNAGPDQTISCAILPGGSATMAGTGLGTWAAMTGNPGTATINATTSPTTSITTFTSAGIYKFIWTNASGCSDTASITVTAKPNAGPDQVVNCAILPGGTASMAATGAGSWTAMTGNPGTATITSATSPATSITGFTNAGTYKYIWVNVSGCSDTASIIVTAKPNAGPDQTVSCAVLPGGTATMAATGAGAWTAMTGNPGTAAITSTTSPATSITTFTVAGTYKFVWTNAYGCSDTASVTVTAKPNAGPDQSVSCAVLPGGAATMAGTGTGTWTAMTGNPGTATIVGTTSPTTNITTFSNPGTYKYIWTNASGCSDTASITVTEKPNAGPDQTVTCAILPGGTATMVATGAGTWTAMTGNPGTATITSATSPHTSITGFTIGGTYKYLWTNASGCSDTASINVSAKPNAGPDQTVSCAILPGGTATMAGTGLGTWAAMTGNPGAATINATTSPTTGITTFTSAGTYKFIWTNASGCSDTASITVTAKPNAGPDQVVNCAILPGGTASMAATGAGSWTAMTGNPGTATITSATSPATSITGFTNAGTYKYIWVNVSGCSDTASITVTAKPDAGVDQVVSCAVLPGGRAMMAATGAGFWSPMGGNPGTAIIASAGSSSTLITGFTNGGTYKFIWANASGCSDTVSITVTAKPNAGSDQTVSCAVLPGGTANMAGIGTGTWTAMTGNPGTATIASATNPTTSITAFTSAGTYKYIWTNVSGCSDTASITVTEKPNAGPDQTVGCAVLPGGQATMAATGIGTWTAMTGNPCAATIASNTNPSTTITGFTSAGTYKFIWTNASGCSDTASITVTAKPNAGSDQTINCAVLPGGYAAMTGIGQGTWTAMTGNPGIAAITNVASPTTTITGYTSEGTYKFIWTNASGCSDTASITVTAKPNAGPDQTVNCAVIPGGSATMAATGTGSWTAMNNNPGAATITNAINPSTTITGYTAAGIYKFIWTNASGCSDTASITVTAKPNAGPDQIVDCAVLPGGSATMAGSGSGMWTAMPGNPGMATITAIASPTTVITRFTNAGTYNFIWTNASGCSDTASITVTAKPNAGPDQTVSCAVLPGGNATMAGTGIGTWTAMTGNPGAATINNAASPTTNITGFTNAGIYKFIWTNASGCSDTASVVVTEKPNAGPDQTVSCALLPGGTAAMAATGTGTWTAMSSNPGAATITVAASPTTTITGFSAAGSYGFIWINASGCSDTASVVVTEQPTVRIPNISYCQGGNATLSSTVAPAGGSYLWSTAQTSSSITVNAMSNTNVTLTYTWGACSAIARDTVTVYTSPSVTVATTPSICTGHNGTIKVLQSAVTSAYSYSWSSPGGVRDSLTNLAPGNYQVTVTDANHCSATASGIVGLLTPNIAVNEMSQHNLKCFNDASGEIYISATDTAGHASYYTNTYNWSNTTHNQNLSNVQAGTYHVTVTDQFGCTGTATYTLTQPSALSATTSMTDPLCHGTASGTATINPVGGSGSYHYRWSTSPTQNTRTATGLMAGTYTVTMTDDSLCLITKNVSLTNPQSMVFASATISNPKCHGDSNGTALVTPQNGAGSYTYAWSYRGLNSNPAMGLPSGAYTVTVTDANGCTVSTQVTLTEPPPFAVNVMPTNISCYGLRNGSVSATSSGGTPPYSFLWNTQDSSDYISHLVAGTYTITATDHHRCAAVNSATITQPTSLSDSLASERTNCPDSRDGTITAVASGGSGSYTYTLEDNTGLILMQRTNGIFIGLGYGLYQVKVTDKNQCPAIDTITVQRAPFNSYTSSSTPVTCYGPQYHDGSIHVQGYGIPNSPFQYSLDGGPFQSTNDFYNLTAGPHTVIAHDHYGCDTTFTIVVGQPQAAVVQIVPADTTIAGGASVQLVSSFGPYPADSIRSYQWSPAAGLNCSDCVAPTVSPYANQTIYTLSITYNSGCVVSTTAQINVNGHPPLYVPNAFSPNGDGVNDVWGIFGTGIKEVKNMVFNRWGEKVFETEDQFQSWDGMYRGELQPTGVYVYLVEVVYLDGETDNRKGSITLIR